MTPNFAGSSLEHYARTVSPSHWRESLIVMLTICCDCGGKDQTGYNVIAVAEFASFAGLWEEFTARWNARLQQDGLPYFHAGEFAHSTGAFKEGWKGNKALRESLATDLMEIIEELGLRKFGTILRLEDFKFLSDERKKQYKNWTTMQAFAFAAMRTIEAFHDYAKGEGINRNVRYVFEKGDPENDLRKTLRGFGFSEPDFMWGKPHIDNKGFEHEPFVGLQAAGWIAYEYYLDSNRLMYSGEPTDRWAFQRFEKLPGQLVLMGRNLRSPDVPSLNDFMAQQEENVRLASDYLAYIKHVSKEKGE